MGTKTLWTPESGVSLLTTELNNAADGAIIVDGADYDNATNLFRWAAFFLHLQDFDAAPAAGSTVELHLFYKLDGTLYADGEEGDAATPTPTGNSMHGLFQIEAVDGPQNQQVLGVPLLPFAFRAAVVLNLTTDLTDVATHYLKMYPYNEDQP